MSIHLPEQAYPLIYLTFEIGIPFLAILIYLSLVTLVSLRFKHISFKLVLIWTGIITAFRELYLQLFDLIPKRHILPIVFTPHIEKVMDRIQVGFENFTGTYFLISHPFVTPAFSLGYNIMMLGLLYMFCKKVLAFRGNRLLVISFAASLGMFMWIWKPFYQLLQ